jgi:hypothetical protein
MSEALLASALYTSFGGVFWGAVLSALMLRKRPLHDKIILTFLVTALLAGYRWITSITIDSQIGSISGALLVVAFGLPIYIRSRKAA